MDSLFKEYKNAFGEETPMTEGAVAVTKGGAVKKQRVFGFSPFALQDAIGEKNVKKIWLEYEKLIFAGISAEELIHKIVSKVKDMAMIERGASKEDLGVKDYPFAKSKKDLKNWEEAELKDFYTKLVTIYHESRMVGGDDLDTAIEKTILGV